MKGLMMDFQLTLPPLLRRVETFFGAKEIVTRLPDKSFHRYTWRDMARRSKQLAVALQRVGLERGALAPDRRCDRPRLDDRHLDPPRRELDAQSVADRFDRVLRRRVRAEERQRAAAGDRPDEDDAAACAAERR